jgi:signal transduction histidine kinase
MLRATTESQHAELYNAPPPFPEVLSQTAQLLLQDADPDTLCQAVFRTLRRRFNIDVYFHFLVSEDRSFLELASSGGNAQVRAAMGMRLDFGNLVCGTVARTCAPIYVSEVNSRQDAMTAYIREHGVRSYVCNPLLLGTRLLGTLSFGSTTRASFAPHELELFALVAKQVTLATDRRAQNERLRQLERLATAGRMSATLAHEINNPLESLANLLYLVRDEVQKPDAQELLTQAEAQVQRLTDIVQRTLDMFRGSLQTPQVLDLGDLVRDLLTGLTLPQHARLDRSIEEGLCVKAIPGELRQVLFNLLTNAAHFTRPGTPVTLTVRRNGNFAEIRVRDEGEGISESSRARLFQPFFTTRKSEGTGIGLWLSKEMIERAGGRLSFASDPAVAPGTEFTATLPLVGN